MLLLLRTLNTSILVGEPVQVYGIESADKYFAQLVMMTKVLLETRFRQVLSLPTGLEKKN